MHLKKEVYNPCPPAGQELAIRLQNQMEEYDRFAKNRMIFFIIKETIFFTLLFVGLFNLAVS